VVGDTRRSYWSLYYAVRAIDATRESRDLLASLRDVVQAKYRAGAATQESVLRTSVELGNLDMELITLEQRRATAAAMLNTLLDRSADAALPAPSPIDLVHVDARLDDLLASARRSSPALRSIASRIERYREERELARLGRYPDVTVSLSYNAVRNEGLSPVTNGDDQWWIGFGVNLPIWADRLAAAEREATRGMLETAGTLAGERNRVAFRVQDAFIKVESQQRQAVLLRDAIVPEAAQTVEASLSGYRAGTVEFLALIDNWRKLLDFKLMYQASLAELERSFAELQEAVGGDLVRSPPAGAHGRNGEAQDGGGEGEGDQTALHAEHER
jgi:outer membrane protein TolC